MNFFDEATLRLKQQLKATEDKQVAAELGLAANAWAMRKKRNSFPEKELRALAQQRPDLKIDVDYVLTGSATQATGRPSKPLHERLYIAMGAANLHTAEQLAKALGISEQEARLVLAGRRPLDAALLEPLRKLGVDVQYILRGDDEDRSQVEFALNATELKLLRDYRASSVDVQGAVCAALAFGAAQANPSKAG